MRGKGALKAISPLIATVLLISATFTLAFIVSSWSNNLVEQNKRSSEKALQYQAACSGGILKYLDTGAANPIMAGDRIKALIEVDGVPLTNFTFELTLNSFDIKYLSDTTNSSLAPGPRNRGTIISESTTIPRENISLVAIKSNCNDAKTVAKPLG